jgi:hypothetical protein
MPQHYQYIRLLGVGWLDLVVGVLSIRLNSGPEKAGEMSMGRPA